MNNQKDVPVYLFTGFLEAGKTKFIQETLEDKRFCNGERTLLLVCEEGEEEYAPDQFADRSVMIRTIESPEEMTVENLSRMLIQTNAERVVIEYNGMWLLDLLYSAMPENWMVYQEFMFADATTFLSYNANMRQLVYDKLKSCELVVFNRFRPDMDKLAFHKIVRGASRRSDIAYEYPGALPTRCPLIWKRPSWRSATTISPSGTVTCPRSRRSTRARPCASAAARCSAKSCRRTPSSWGATS